jgi:hypothetical protein
LAIGFWALLIIQLHTRFRVALALSLIGQVGLYLAYGNETFLYALNWIPLFVTAAALATLTRARSIVLAFALVFIITAGIHNVQALQATLVQLAVNAT